MNQKEELCHGMKKSTIEKTYSYSYFEGKFVLEQEAKISIQTNAFQYGNAVFGGIRGYFNENQILIFRVEDHYERLLNSCKMLQLKIDKTKKELIDITVELIRKSNWKKNLYIRPIIYNSGLGLTPILHNNETDLAIYIIPLEEYLDTSHGLKTMVSSWHRISDNMIPTSAKASGGYVNSSLAKSEAIQNGYDEAIFLDHRGFVSEGSAANIFIIRNRVVITPPKTASILEGITRKTVFTLLEDLDISYIERDIDKNELYIADEVFFSGTGAQIAWIREIDKRIIGNGKIGEITKKIQDLFFSLVKGKIKKYEHWLKPVY